MKELTIHKIETIIHRDESRIPAVAWGRGILNIFTYCKEAGLPELEYDFVTHFVCLTIDRHLAVLVKEDLIEHRNSDRNGGYYAK